MKIRLNKNWYIKVEDALRNWKTVQSREKFKSVLFGFLLVQRDKKRTGFKKLLGKSVVPVSDRVLREAYHDSSSRSKFRKLLSQYQLIEKDHSYISRELADRLFEEPRCSSWHITEPDYKGESIEVQFDLSLGCFGSYSKAIKEAEDMPVNETDIFKGKWAFDAYQNNEISFAEFMEVGKVASILLHGTKLKSQCSCRDYDAVTLCKKTLREKCFINKETGKGMHEIFDISGAITFTAPLGSSALLPNEIQFNDSFLKQWSIMQADSTYDPYLSFFKKMKELDTIRDFYLSNRKWTKSVRKSLKADVQVVVNCNLEYIESCRKAYHNEIRLDRREYFSKVRQWILWKSIRQVNKSFFHVALLCKYSGVKDAFYRVHTFGEKMIIEYLVKSLKGLGFTVHRVHDALWTTRDDMNEKGMKEIVRIIVSKLFNGVSLAKTPRKAIERLSSPIHSTIKSWVFEALDVKMNIRNEAIREIYERVA